MCLRSANKSCLWRGKSTQQYSPTKKFKSKASPCKVMFTVLRGVKWVVFWKFIPTGCLCFTASPHTNLWTTVKVRRLGFTVWDHPLCRSDLARRNFVSFPNWKEHLRGHNKVSNNGVKTAVRLRFRHQDAQFYRNGLTEIIVKGKGELRPVTTTQSHKGNRSTAVFFL
jgi:hypothetical protein